MAINSSASRAVHLLQYFSPASLFLFCFISWGCADAMLVFNDSFVGGQVSNGIFVFMPTLFLIIFCFILIFLCLLRESLFAGRSNLSLRNVWFSISDFWLCYNALLYWPFSASYHSASSVLFPFCILHFFLKMWLYSLLLFILFFTGLCSGWRPSDEGARGGYLYVCLAIILITILIVATLGYIDLGLLQSLYHFHVTLLQYRCLHRLVLMPLPQSLVLLVIHFWFIATMLSAFVRSSKYKPPSFWVTVNLSIISDFLCLIFLY